jgi:transposase-like protein
MPSGRTFAHQAPKIDRPSRLVSRSMRAFGTQDRDALLAFYDFPAEHWKHLRTSNVIESTFATIRHRTVRSKGCLSNKTAPAMMFKLAKAAEKAGVVSMVTTSCRKSFSE